MLYPKEFEVKVENQGDYAIFLEFEYNHKGRNLSYTSHLIKEIPSPFKLWAIESNLYSAIKVEFLRITFLTLSQWLYN